MRHACILALCSSSRTSVAHVHSPRLLIVWGTSSADCLSAGVHLSQQRNLFAAALGASLATSNAQRHAARGPPLSTKALPACSCDTRRPFIVQYCVCVCARISCKWVDGSVGLSTSGGGHPCLQDSVPLLPWAASGSRLPATCLIGQANSRSTPDRRAGCNGHLSWALLLHA